MVERVVVLFLNIRNFFIVSAEKRMIWTEKNYKEM